MQETNISANSLLLLSQAAKAAHTSRGNFHRLVQRQLVPPPIIDLPVRRWSHDQIQRWRRGQVRRNEHGIWFEWLAESEKWRRLPNQYTNNLPLDAA